MTTEVNCSDHDCIFNDYRLYGCLEPNRCMQPGNEKCYRCQGHHWKEAREHSIQNRKTRQKALRKAQADKAKAWKKAKAERERVLPLVLKAKETQLALFRRCWDKNTIELVKQVGMDIRAIEESLRQEVQQ